MPRSISRLIATLVVSVLGLALPARAAGPLEADPAHHKLEIENEWVQVVRSEWGPREASAAAIDFTEGVVVRLTPGHFRVTTPEGKVLDRNFPLGAVYPILPGRLRVENALDQASVSILVFTKNRGTSSTALPPLHPLIVDPRHFKLVIENDRVRVMRVTFGPGESSPGLFDGPGAVQIALTPRHLEVQTAEGKTIDRQYVFGAVTMLPAARVRPKNVGEMGAEFIVIEPK